MNDVRSIIRLRRNRRKNNKINWVSSHRQQLGLAPKRPATGSERSSEPQWTTREKKIIYDDEEILN